MNEEKQGYTILLKENDVVVSEGPAWTAVGNMSTWVPEGTKVNGKLVTESANTK